MHSRRLEVRLKGISATVEAFSQRDVVRVVNDNDRSQRLARLVRRLRGDASTYVFGAQLGMTHSTIRRWESGQGGINEEGVEKLSNGTGISADMIRAYLRGSINLRACLGLEAPTQSGAQSLIEQLATLSISELLMVLEATITHLLRRLPNVRPEIAQIFQAAIGLLNISPSAKQSKRFKATISIEQRFLPQTIQDAISDEIEARYGSVNSRTIARFAETAGIQPSDRLVEVIQGESPQKAELLKLQPHLHKHSDQCWSIEELLELDCSKKDLE
ncbi:hypothetical protein H6F89_20310 [Cyanobacteria bacterium FACHB-63]|nr:hypothetical protein [Cyanobacteria bacterium FACHB-63]